MPGKSVGEDNMLAGQGLGVQSNFLVAWLEWWDRKSKPCHWQLAFVQNDSRNIATNTQQ